MKRYCNECELLAMESQAMDLSHLVGLTEKSADGSKDYTVWVDNPKAGQPMVDEDGKPVLYPNFKSPGVPHKKAGQQKIEQPQKRDYQAEADAIDQGLVDDVLELKKHLTITKGIEKLAGINSLNVDPRVTPICKKFNTDKEKVCYNCYSLNSIDGRKPSLGTAYRINARMMTSRVFEPGEWPKSNLISDLFRINSHGDIIDEIHLQNIVNFLKQFIDSGDIKYCAWWTKAKGWGSKINGYLNRAGIRKKVSLIFSTYTVNDPSPKVPSGFDASFSVYSYDWLKENAHNPSEFITCGGKKCKGCNGGKCYTPGIISDIKELLKQDAKRADNEVSKGFWQGSQYTNPKAGKK